MTAIPQIDHMVETTQRWLAELAGELGTDDRHDAYRAMRAVLQALRDELPVAETAQLAAQVPTVLRGILYEGWRPGAPARTRDPDAFLRRIAADAGLHGETEASMALDATMRVLRSHVSAGEIADVVAVLPAALRPLVDGSASPA